MYNSISDTSKCALDTRPWVVRVHFIYVGFFELIVSTLTTVLVSYLTTPLPRAQLAGLTWWTRNDSKEYNIAVDSSPKHAVDGPSTETSVLVRNDEVQDVHETSFGRGATSDRNTDGSSDDMPGSDVDVHTLDSPQTEESVESVCWIRFSPRGLKWFLRVAVAVQLGTLFAVWIVFR